MKEIIEKFLESKKYTSSSNTYKAYFSDLKYLEKHFDSLIELNNYDKLHKLKKYLSEKYSQKTIARKWSVYREFFTYCLNKKIIKDNKILNISNELANYENKISKEKLDHKLLELICDSNPIWWFFYSTGVRVKEFLQYAKLKNLNLVNKEFILPNRKTFLCSKAFNLLQNHLKKREVSEYLNLDSDIFTDFKGQTLTENYLYTAFIIDSKKLGLNFKLKDLRKSLIIRLLENNAKAEDIIYMLGFKSEKSLEKFLT